MGGLGQSLEVLFLGPREWKPLVSVRSLWKVEALLWLHYTFRFTPLDIWLGARGSSRPFGDFRYGETPWFTGIEILRAAELSSSDRFVDLGCGRGKMVFLANLLCGAMATGVDLLESYLRVARRMARLLGLEQVSFLDQDFASTDLSDATVVYVAGSIFSGEARSDLAALVDQLPSGARWISVGWPTDHPRLTLREQQEHLFTWGREMVYYHAVEG